MQRKIIVTSALPYANGPIHLGHLVEYLQTDFWVRFQKMRGNACIYMCADDTHGTPMMIRARKEGTTPEAIIAKSYAEHVKDFAQFEISFDRYYTTNSTENETLSRDIFQKIKLQGDISTRTVAQLFCEHDNMFLPDRFVKGICPKCAAPNQYGDSCDACGATYGVAELVEPACSICSRPPVMRDSEQLFFELEPSREFLEKWIPAHTAPDIAKKLMEWFGEPLRGWNISRDAPYFGFEIPGHPGKYFYVWLDAPIGYMATVTKWCEEHNQTFDDWWGNPSAEVYHFIGKDIVRFHCLFWPALLHRAGYRTPNEVFVHGFLTVNGEKMSKSKGTFINARTYLTHLPAQALRFYYACKLNGSTDDMDWNLDDFVNRVNSDLVGKITNLASRGAQMLHKHFAGAMTAIDKEGHTLLKHFHAQQAEIAEAYEKRDFCRVMVLLRTIADEANKYFDAKAPWALVKTDPAATQAVLTSTLNFFRFMAVCLKPILPLYAEKAETLFGEPAWQWADAQNVVENTAIAPYAYLATRIETAQVQAMVEASKAALPAPAPAPKKEVKKTQTAFPEPPAPEIDYETFSKVDLRVAKILEAQAVEGSDKLIRVLVDAGDPNPRQIFAGIRASYDPAALIGRSVIIVANLAPRKMRFGLSEGMILAAANADGALFAALPDGSAAPGARVR